MKTLAASTLVVAGVWTALWCTPSPIPPRTAWYDTMLVYEIAIAFTTAAVVMVISRRTWTIRAIGLLFSAFAVGLLFWNAVYVRQSGYRVNENGRVVPNTNHGLQEGVSDLARALLVVGGPLLMVGLVMWLWGRFGPEHDPVVEPTYPEIERRTGPADRRAPAADVYGRTSGGSQ